MRLRHYTHGSAPSPVPEAAVDIVRQALADTVRVSKTSTRQFREDLATRLTAKGWSGPARIDPSSRISVTSTFQDIALCVQTGNMSRFYADLLKLETLYRKKAIKAALYVIPLKDWAVHIGSNIANFERLVEELKIFSDTVTIPMLVLGFSGEN
jgi:hypothetical protein